MSSDEVRIRLCYGYRPFQDCWEDAPPDAPLDGDGEEYGPVLIAVRAAKHAALMRVVGAAVAYELAATKADRLHREMLRSSGPGAGSARVAAAEAQRACEDAERAIIREARACRALTATAPSRQGEASK